MNFARQRPWQESVCSSLTELFAPHIHQQRISSWPSMYPWINEDGLVYFKKRLTEARRDVEQGLGVTLDYFSTSREMQLKALDILQFKLDVLWVMADAIMLACTDIKEETKRGYPGFINLIGMESPGLTSSIAIANYVNGLINNTI